MTYKHKTHAVDSDGKIISNADVDFYIDDDGHLIFQRTDNVTNIDFEMRNGRLIVVWQ